MAAPGSIKRLNVAVLVNDDVNATQQDSIMRTVSSAAGINQDRGDTISVEPLPFSTELKDKRAAEEKAAKDKADRIFYMEVAAALLVLALIIGALMMRRRRKLQEQAALEEQQRLEEEERQRLAAERAKKWSRANWKRKNSPKRNRDILPKSRRCRSSSIRSRPRWLCLSRPGFRRMNKWHMICMETVRSS